MKPDKASELRECLDAMRDEALHYIQDRDHWAPVLRGLNARRPSRIQRAMAVATSDLHRWALCEALTLAVSEYARMTGQWHLLTITAPGDPGRGLDFMLLNRQAYMLAPELREIADAIEKIAVRAAKLAFESEAAHLGMVKLPGRWDAIHARQLELLQAARARGMNWAQAYREAGISPAAGKRLRAQRIAPQE